MTRALSRLLLRRALEARPADLAAFAFVAVWISLMVSR